MKGDQKNPNLTLLSSTTTHPLSTLESASFGASKLTPVTLQGVVKPNVMSSKIGERSDYKLVCASGVEYFILADSEWRKMLARYCWLEVQISGLLNMSKRTLVPKKIHPKGPRGDLNNLIDLSSWKKQKLAKVAHTLTEMIFVPAAILALMA